MKCKLCDNEIILNIGSGGHNKIYCDNCRKIKSQSFCTKSAYKRRTRRKYWLNKYKLAVGCQLCGYKDNYNALQWDHVDPLSKVSGVATLSNSPLKTLFLEIRKCRVLCANCHSIHTYSTRHTKRSHKLTTQNDEF